MNKENLILIFGLLIVFSGAALGIHPPEIEFFSSQYANVGNGNFFEVDNDFRPLLNPDSDIVSLVDKYSRIDIKYFQNYNNDEKLIFEKTIEKSIQNKSNFTIDETNVYKVTSSDSENVTIIWVFEKDNVNYLIDSKTPLKYYNIEYSKKLDNTIKKIISSLNKNNGN